MLKSDFLFGIEVATQFGQVKFNENGECKTLTEDQEKYLAERVPGLSFIEEKKAPVKKASPKAVAKEEPKEEPKEEKKPTPRKRTTTRKKTEE